MKQFLAVVGVYIVLAIGVVYVAQQQAGAERGIAALANRDAISGTN